MDLTGKPVEFSTYGRVYRAKSKLTFESRLVKMVSKKGVERFGELQKVIDLMREAGNQHPNILKLYETFQDHRYYYF